MDIDTGLSVAYLARVVVILLTVIVAIVGFAWIMRRVSGVQSRPGSQLRVVSGISLGARERMLLVQVGDRQLLVGVTPGRVQTLYVLDEPVPADDSGTGQAVHPDSPFARTLHAALQRKRMRSATRS